MNGQTNAKVRFDDALPRFAELVIKHLGASALRNNAFLRDSGGRLTYVLRDLMPVAATKALAEEAATVLGGYADAELCVASPSELLDPSLENTKDDIIVYAGDRDSIAIRLIERKIVGQDWSRPNFSPIPNVPPVIVFYSCKGGVGRSTALSVASAALAKRNLNILVVDFDLEAPGLASILLKPDEAPEFGALDYFVENGVSGIDAEFLERCVAPSPLTAGAGLVEVVPAIGTRGSQFPSNVIAKLGRAFLEDSNEGGGTVSFLDQCRSFLEALSRRGRYDSIFVDARSGLSESTAAALLGLGGDVLMFGVDAPQTFQSYSYLFAHLSYYVQNADTDNDWRRRFRMVHAKANRGDAAARSFREQSRQLFEDFLYEDADPSDSAAFNFDFDDEAAPHYAWSIPHDVDFLDFDPKTKPDQFQEDFFGKTFGPFVDRLEALIRRIERSNGS